MNKNEYILDFIKQENFEKHILETLNQYKNVLKSFNLKKFNLNKIDPIKLLFDKNYLNRSYKEIIDFEIQRQRDKSNNNIIGYFHQNLFKYIKDCEVPKKGWDIIYKSKNNIYYVEIKNKHNTMNSSSASKTYMKMQNHLLNSPDKNKSICALVEVIAPKSQNISWKITLEEIKQKNNDQLRRISIDKFYEIVTGNKNAFYLLCKQLPITIEKIISQNNCFQLEQDTVYKELINSNNDILSALYYLVFSTYEGFKNKKIIQ